MYQKQISSLIGEISSLAVEVTLSGKAIAFVDHQAHVNLIRVQIANKNDWKVKVYENEIWFEGVSFNLNRSHYETEALKGLLEIKLELQKYLTVNPFHSIWEKYQPIIEKEIIEDIALGRQFDEEQLFHDVMLETTGHEISLECVYQSLKLSNGEGYAKLFKSEMLSNIEWLSNNINANWSEYEKELDAV